MPGLTAPRPPDRMLQQSLEELGLPAQELAGLGFGMTPNQTNTTATDGLEIGVDDDGAVQTLRACLLELVASNNGGIDLEDLMELNEHIFCTGVPAEGDMQVLLHRVVQVAADLFLHRPQEMMADADRYKGFGCELLVLLGNVQSQPGCTAEQRAELLQWMSQVSHRAAEQNQGGIDRSAFRIQDRRITRNHLQPLAESPAHSQISELRSKVSVLQKSNAALEEQNGALHQLCAAGINTDTGVPEAASDAEEIARLRKENADLKEERSRLHGILKLWKMKMEAVQEVVQEFNTRALDDM
mmetsp:Transcript_55599/g.121797  ORF Transcript_55599/g.121797 Transcript_55599/m.121797 type:complete len:299 (+) Transcript_55599:26-922(+)